MPRSDDQGEVVDLGPVQPDIQRRDGRDDQKGQQPLALRRTHEAKVFSLTSAGGGQERGIRYHYPTLTLQSVAPLGACRPTAARG